MRSRRQKALRELQVSATVILQSRIEDREIETGTIEIPLLLLKSLLKLRKEGTTLRKTREG